MKKEEIIVKIIETTDKTYVAQTIGEAVVRIAALLVAGTVMLYAIDVLDNMMLDEQMAHKTHKVPDYIWADNQKVYTTPYSSFSKKKDEEVRPHYDWGSSSTLHGDDSE